MTVPAAKAFGGQLRSLPLQTSATSHGPPRVSILFQSALALVMLWSATYETLLTFIGFTLSVTVMTLLYWGLLACNVLAPQLFWWQRARQSIPVLLFVAMCVNVGMWLERYNIVVPTSLHPRGGLATLHYLPSWVELSIMAGTFSGFVLLYMAATKFFPIISIWEIREGREEGVKEVEERVKSYLPDEVKGAA